MKIKTNVKAKTPLETRTRWNTQSNAVRHICPALLFMHKPVPMVWMRRSSSGGSSLFSQRERCSAFSPTSSRFKCLFLSFFLSFPSLPSLQGTSLFAAHAFSFFLLLLLLSFSCFSPHAPPPPKKREKTATAIFFTGLRSDECTIQRGNVPRLSSFNEVRAGCICQSDGASRVLPSHFSNIHPPLAPTPPHPLIRPPNAADARFFGSSV